MVFVYPEVIPTTPSSCDHGRKDVPVVSYSDGEGADAGIGICIYVHGRQPRAAYTRVHPVVRRYGRSSMMTAGSTTFVRWKRSARCWWLSAGVTNSGMSTGFIL